MIKSIIVAKSINNVIGKNGQIPWYISADLKNFKKLTMGHCVIMGRRTFESISLPLHGRHIIVITRNKGYYGSGCVVMNSVESALRCAELLGETEVFIAGGGDIYAECIKIADKIYMTSVHRSMDGDVFFPNINLTDWKVVDYKATDDCDFMELRRVMFSD